MKIAVERNGSKVEVTKQQLFTMAKNGQIRAKSTIWVDGKEVLAEKIQGLVFGQNGTGGSLVKTSQEISAEYNGKQVKCTKEQLIEAASKGLISPETKVWIGPHSGLAKQLPWLKFSDQAELELPYEENYQSTPSPMQVSPSNQAYSQPQYSPQQYAAPQVYPDQAYPQQYASPVNGQAPIPMQNQFAPQTPLGSKFCQSCGNAILPSAVLCPRCGSPVADNPGMNLPRKSRTTYILLAFFFGGLGIHNFYAKRTGTAVIQLLLTVLTLGAGGVITLPWSLIDMICIKKDGFGMDFE